MCIQGGYGRGEGAGDVMAEVAIGIGMDKVTCGLVEGEPLIRKLLAYVCNLAGMLDNLGAGCTIVDDFHMEGIITFLIYGPSGEGCHLMRPL